MAGGVTAADYLLVAAGGALGSIGRVALQQLTLPWSRLGATVYINLAGCLLIGIVWVVLDRTGAGRGWSNFIIGGVLGGFTTFSSFALQPALMAQAGIHARAAGYVALSVIGGLAACGVGMWAATKLFDLME